MRFLLLGIMLLLTSCNEMTEELSGDYNVHFSGNKAVILRMKNEEIVVPCNVISYAFNEEFIVAAQAYDAECEPSPNAARHDTTLHFWIIDQAEHHVFGPMTLAEYVKKKHELNIPADVKIEL